MCRPPRSTLFLYTTLFRSLRMYEARGLITPKRSPKNTRLYSFDDVERVEPGVLGGALRRDQRSEEHTSELQSPYELVCRLLPEKKKHDLAPFTTQTDVACI